jgi:hypothetical protein
VREADDEATASAAACIDTDDALARIGDLLTPLAGTALEDLAMAIEVFEISR